MGVRVIFSLKNSLSPAATFIEPSDHAERRLAGNLQHATIELTSSMLEFDPASFDFAQDEAFFLMPSNNISSP